jgi:D-galactarolactone isomerase
MGFRKVTSESREPKLKAPPGACDTHIHFYNAKFPTAPSALMMPEDAWIDDYKDVQRHLSLERVVAVQPTAYGLDNSCQIEAMTAFGDRIRGVFVVDDRTPERELDRLTKLGGRGARFHMLPGGAVPWDILEKVAARVHDFGWHIQLQLNGRELPEREAMLKRLPGGLVIDHVGRFTPPADPGHEAFKVLLRLLEGGNCWVKLSAPYESFAGEPLDYGKIAVEARALVAAAPQRMLWASNWPHPGKDWLPEDAQHLDLLLDWIDDMAVRDRILVDNAVELYGFGSE